MKICELTSPGHKRVLIVDDEESVRRLVDRILQGAGYVTWLASSGAAALTVAEGLDPIELLVTDMMMPEMSGDEVARRLRQKNPALKVLYCTGFADRLFDEKRTLWQDEAFIEKPCSARGLLEAVSLLRNRNRSIGDVSLERTGAPAAEVPVKPE